MFPVPHMMDSWEMCRRWCLKNRIQRRTAEQIVDMPVFKVFSQGRVEQRSVEQNMENPVDNSISQILGGKCRDGQNCVSGVHFWKDCEQGWVIDVSKISSQDRLLQRTVEQTPDESCVPRDREQQRTAKQMDDATHLVEDVVEMERLVPRERELQLTAVQVAEMVRERYGDRDAPECAV